MSEFTGIECEINRYGNYRKIGRIGKTLKELRKTILCKGQIVKTKRWQGKTDHPNFLELLHVDVLMKMEQTIEDMQKECNPMLPWADEHFEERVSGIPWNPPPSHKHWLKGNEEYMDGEIFDHTYPERIWPKSICPDRGVRFEIADLNDLIELLKDDPETRQAYLPIFFPEDLTAARKGKRVPCTLGWHFIVRNNRLDLFYPMRSCDVVRHLHNDFYLANRLALYVKERSNLDVDLGIMHFVATSLHCFETDKLYLKKITKD